MIKRLLLGAALGAMLATPALAQDEGRENRGNNASRQAGRGWSGEERPERAPEKVERRAERKDAQTERREERVEQRTARVERADNDDRGWRGRPAAQNPAGHWTRSNDDQARARVERRAEERRDVAPQRVREVEQRLAEQRARNGDDRRWDRDRRDRDGRWDRDDRRQDRDRYERYARNDRQGDRDDRRYDRNDRRYDRGDWRFDRNHAYYRHPQRYGYGYGHNRHYREIVPSYVWYRYPYRTWHHGHYFPRNYWSHGWDGYLIDDYYYWDLPRPPRGYGWIRYHDDAILVFLATGLIREVLRDYWW